MVCQQTASVVLLCLLLASSASAQEEIPRKIIAFYHPIESRLDPFFTSVHAYAELPLNHLGLEVIYRPITDTLPVDEELKGVRGFLTWFRGEQSLPEPETFCRWLDQQLKQGRRLVMLGASGMVRDHKTLPACEPVLTRLGVRYQGRYDLSVADPLVMQIIHQDLAMMDFERKLLFYEDLSYAYYELIGSDTTAHLQVRRTDLEGLGPSALIVSGPAGGMVHPGYAIYRRKNIPLGDLPEKSQWRINPFRFFELAFGLEGLPRPDVTTLNGRRIFFTHIDGDGISNISRIKRDHYAGEVIAEEIIAAMPTVPITASLITGWLDRGHREDPRALMMYHKLLSPPHVEPASHGYAHPLKWRQGKMALKIPGYRYSPEREIVGSIQITNQLLESLQIDKQARLFLWTGDCLPTAEMVAISQKTPLLNMNGGDSRMDRLYDSFTNLAPIGLLREGRRQIYAAAPNENIYTHLWSGPYHGFQYVIETFENTERPMRLKPIDVYYHYFSGEHVAALNALKKVYRYALSQPIFPIFASEYVEIANDFFATRLYQTQAGFLIKTAGALKTIRFDRESRHLDMARSQGVLGYQHLQGSLYVFLDETREHRITFSRYPPAQPYLVAASFRVLDFERAGQTIRFAKQGWHRSELIMGGLRAGHEYRIVAGTFQAQQVADQRGQLQLTFPSSEQGGHPTSVTISPQ